MIAATNFDALAQHLAEVIDDVLTVERDRRRRLAIVTKQIRHALSLGFKAGRGNFSESSRREGHKAPTFRSRAGDCNPVALSRRADRVQDVGQ
jgi:hypothetical protein